MGFVENRKRKGVEKERKKVQKGKLRHKSRYMPVINIFLLVILILSLCNFHRLIYILNMNEYIGVEAEVEKQTKDGLFIVFPKYEVNYSYNGKDYDSTETVVENILFKRGIEGTTRVQVNKLAPSNCLILLPFFSSEVNVICVIILAVLFLVTGYSIYRNRKVKDFNEEAISYKKKYRAEEKAKFRGWKEQLRGKSRG